MLSSPTRLLSAGVVATFAFALVARGAPNTGTSVQTREPLEPTTPKLVVARHLVGLTGGGGSGDYVKDTWENDMTLAFSKGIDAFALSVGADEFTHQQVDLAYVPHNPSRQPRQSVA